MRIDASQLSVQRYPPFTVKYTPLGELVRVFPNIPIGPPVFLRRVPSIAGLGDAATSALAVANINRDTQSYLNNLGYDVEQGQVVSPAMMEQGLRDRVTGVCTDVLTLGAGCDPSTFEPQIQQLAQQYATALAAQQAKTAALVASGSIAVPAGYYGGQDLYDPNYAPPGAPAPAAIVPSGGGSQSASVQVTNTSRPGQSFKVGDSFLVTVNGPANQTVAVHGTQNGQDKGTTPFGNTDGSGHFTVSGTMTPDTVGNWTEVWTVGNTQAPPVSFSVSAASSSPAPSSSGSSSGPSSSPAPASTGSSSGPSSSTSSSAPAPASTGFDLSSIMTKLQAPSPVMGLPWLVVIAIGGAGLWWFSSRGKR